MTDDELSRIRQTLNDALMMVGDPRQNQFAKRGKIEAKLHAATRMIEAAFDRRNSGEVGEYAVALIAAERRRQVEAEGWTPAHDDEAEVVAALRSYADDPYSGGSYTDELRARHAADLLEREHKARTEAERERDDLLATIFRDGGQEAARLGKDAVPTAIKRAAEVIGELAALRNRPCPYVHSSGEGTHYCTLPHAAEKELAELRKRIDTEE